MHAMQAKGRRGLAPLIPNLSNVWKRVVTSRKVTNPPPLNTKMGEPQSGPWLFEEEKYILSLSGFETEIISF